MSLTDKQRRFVDAYLLDPNGKKAAIAAGYAPGSAEVAASRLLRHSAVADELDRRRVAISEAAGITPEMVLRELGRLGFADIREVVEWRTVARDLFDAEGNPVDVPELFVSLRDSADIDAAAGRAISEVSRSKDGAVKVKMHDKLGALVKIGQHLGMFQTMRAEAPGKKVEAHERALTADRGTDWNGLLQ
jgi:phage terminase small subunit